VNTYRAEVTREDGWWMIRIPELNLLTQATSWDEVETMARGVIASDQDIEMSDVAVTVEAEGCEEGCGCQTRCGRCGAEVDSLEVESVTVVHWIADEPHNEVAGHNEPLNMFCMACWRAIVAVIPPA
jgi:hypothetical protein